MLFDGKVAVLDQLAQFFQIFHSSQLSLVPKWFADQLLGS
jgi:hypothetical protein